MAWDSAPHATISKPFTEKTRRGIRRGHRITCTDLIPVGSIIAVLHDGSYVNDPDYTHPDARRWFERVENEGNPWRLVLETQPHGVVL